MALPAGWYPVSGDPPGTSRYWDGGTFTTGPKRNVNARNRAGFVKPNSASKWRMASPISRVIATIIDSGAPAAIVLGIANGMGVTVPGRTLASWTDEPRLLGVIVLCMLINQVVLVGLTGLSLGRILLGLRVVDARDKDRSPGLARALLRFVLVGPSIIITAMMYALGKRQGLHDLAAGTAVVYN
jgi:uncharacterized RDD family membrane protein YckC